MPLVDERTHLPIEKSQEQRTDVRSVDIGVGHYEDPAVAQFRDVELVFADPASHRRDDGPDFLMAEHLVESRLFDVQDLAPQRENRLELAVASLFGRATCRVALDQEDLAQRGVALLAIGEFSGKRARIESALPPGQLARLARRLAGARRVDALEDDRLGEARVLLEEGGQRVVDERLDLAPDLGIPEFGFGLPLELRVGDLDRDDRCQPLAHVLTLKLEVLRVFAEVGGRKIGVDRAGERGLEPHHVGTALDGVDRVRERVNRLVVRVVPLKRDLELDAFAAARQEDRLGVEHLPGLVQVLNELDDSAFVVKERLADLLGPLVGERDLDALIQESQFAKTLRQGVVGKHQVFEHLRVRLEGDLGAAALGGSDLAELADRFPALEVLAVGRALAPDLDLEPLGKGVDHRNADSVKASGDLVGVVFELAAGMEDRQHDLGRGLPFRRVHVDRNAAAVVHDRDGVVDVDDHFDLLAEPRLSFVDRVVDHLVDQVVKTHRPRRADVHRRSFTDGFKSFEDLDL